MKASRILLGTICAALAALACSPALGVNDLTVTGAPTSVSGLGTNSTVVTARAPVMDAGIVQQQITQAIDPAKLRVTGLAGITYPFGWSATFSTDGTNFGPAPATAAGWDAIRAVRASGPIDSQGSYNGRQIATGAGTEVSPTSGSFVSGGSSGDGFDVFFDDRNHVFNVFHHEKWPNGRVDCHLRSGASCGPGWPFVFGGASDWMSFGAVDNRYDHLWIPTASFSVPAATQAGFVCVDISDLATGPRYCAGTFVSSFIGMAATPMTPTQNDGVRGATVIGSRLFTTNARANTQADPSQLLCVDMHAQGGLGAPCGPPHLVPGFESLWSLKASGGRLYLTGASASQGGAALMCLVAETLSPCAGWATPKAIVGGAIVEQPSATGAVQGVCTFTKTGSASCFKEDGSTLTPNAWLTSALTGSTINKNPDTVGTRVYWANYYINAGELRCFDVAVAGGSCGANWPINSANIYTVSADPYNANCIWRNGDDGVIRAYNYTGAVGCNSPPPWAELQADAIVPRMACDNGGAVREWRSFELTGPAANTYTSATLTVYTAGGRVVTSGGTTWKDVPIPASGLTVDLSSLAVSDTGPDPTFRVTFAGRSTWDNVSAKVTAVGDAPELCVSYVAESVCPIAPSKVPSGPFSAPFVTAVAATGSATLSGSGQADFGPGSADITVGAANDADCLGTISGTTTVTNSSGPAAVGVPVTLKKADGTVLATTTTDAQGNYSFPRVAAGSGYFVDFGDATGYQVTSATTTAESTNRTVTVGGVTDVDGVYTTVITAPTRASTFPASGGTFNPFAAAGTSGPATPGNGASFTATNKAATRLCDPTTTPPQNGTTVACTLTTRTTAEGTWSVNTNSASADVGKITFTPAAGFSGAAPAQTYQVTDSGSAKAAGTFTPTVVGLPTATNNTSSGAYNTAQQIDVLGNDTAASGATLDSSTLKLCDVAPNAQTPPNCTATSVTIANEGTYAIVNGQVRFTPLATFTGAAQTPVRYQVKDDAGQAASALITPSVTAPTPPTATPGTASVAAGIPKAFTTTTGASGLATAGGAAFDTTRTCLVDPAAPNSCATSLTTSQGTWTLDRTTGIATFTADQGLTPGTLNSVTYRVFDATGQSVDSTLTPTLVGAPTATNNTSSGAYNTPQQIDVLGNDSAASGATLTASTLKLCDIAPNAQTPPGCTATSVTISGEGTYAVVNGQVTFTPLATFTGAAQTPVRYQVKDSANQVADALITPSVSAPAPPTATPQTSPAAVGVAKPFTTLTGTSGLATAGGAAFDTTRTCLVDPANPGICSTGFTIQGEGTWALDRTTGVATFSAMQGATGGQAAQVTYRVFDATGQSATATLTPTLVGAPTATDNTSSGPYNTPQQINVLGNDTAATGATMDAATLKLCDVAPNAQTPPNCAATSVTIANEGTYAVANGQVTFTPLDTFRGTVATPVRYQVKDTANQPVDALITPSVTAPTPPTATPGTATVAAGVPKAFTTTTGASGLATQGGAAFDTTRTCLVDPAAPNTCATSLTTTQGTWSLDRSTGVATFTANASGLTPGQLNSVTYRVFDKTGQSTDSTLTPTLVGPPTATDNTSSGAWNTPQQINVLANDSAASGATLTASTLKLCDIAPNAQTPPNCAATSVTIANEGTYTVANGQVTFTPLATFTGAAQTPVRYQVKDSANQPVSALITPSVTAPPVPTASPEGRPVARGQSVAFTTVTGTSGLATSGGPAFTTSSTCLIAPGTTTCAQGTTVTVQGEGTWTLDRSSGVVTFTADPNAPLGALTPIGYRVTDALGRTAESTLTPRVVAPPEATDNATTAIWNTPVVIDPLANDTADALTALNPTSVKLCATTPTPQTPPNCTATTLSIPGEGSYSVDPFTGKITFTPDPAFTGDATPIRYQVHDGAGQVADARILLSVSPVAPTASGDSATVPAGGTATLRPAITPGTWPIDPSKTCLTVGTTCAPGATTLTLPEGTYTLDPATGAVAFTAAPGFSGPAANPPKVMFTDMGGQSVLAPLAITVQPVPPASTPPATAPIALPDVESTGPGQPVTIPILTNDSSTGEGAFDPATLMLKDPATGRYARSVTIPGQGTFQVNADGTVTFTPVPGFTGATRALAYTVKDALGRATSSTLQVIVQQGEPPWADPDFAQGPTGKPLTLNPLANDDAGPSPFDAASLRLKDPTTGKLVTRLTIPGEGTYVVDPSTGKVTFTPVKGFAGKATPIRYRVRTTANRPAESTITVHITSPGPALQIRTTASRPVLRVGQRTTITLKIGNAGGQTAKATVTRAAIPRGFSVVNPMGGTVRDGYIYFRTGNLKAGGSTTRRFVLVAGSAAVGPKMAVYGRSRGGNVGPVASPAMIRVVAPATKAAPVTG